MHDGFLPHHSCIAKQLLIVGKLQRRGGLPVGRGGELSNAGDTRVGVVVRQRDLCECHRSSSAVRGGKLPLVSRISLGVMAVGGIPWCRGWDVDDGRRRKGWSWSLEVAAAQPGEEILFG
ncbi:unnamed protein product, partial [Vitis vinifera]